MPDREVRNLLLGAVAVLDVGAQRDLTSGYFHVLAQSVGVAANSAEFAPDVAGVYEVQAGQFALAIVAGAAFRSTSFMLWPAGEGTGSQRILERGITLATAPGNLIWTSQKHRVFLPANCRVRLDLGNLGVVGENHFGWVTVRRIDA